MARSAPAWITASAALIYLTFLEWVFPQTFFWDDNLTQFLPWYDFNYLALCHGVIPQFNFYQYLGQTYLSNAQNGVFYPPVFFAQLLSHFTHIPSLGIEWLVWIHLAAASLVVERLTRTLGARMPFSFLSALLYLTAPCVIGSCQLWVLVSYVLFYVPLSFLQIERCLTQPTPRRILQLGLIKALFLLSGHVNYFALSVLYEAAYLILRCGLHHRLLSVGLTWLTANFLGLLGALPSVGPVLAHLHQSAERDSPLTYNQVMEAHIEPLTLLEAQFGVFRDHFFCFQAAWCFFGASLFILPALIFFAHRSPRLIPWLILLALALAFCTPFFWILHPFPIYHSFRWPGKNLLFVALFYAVASTWLNRIISPRFAFYTMSLGLSLNLLVFLLPITRHGAERYPRAAAEIHLPLEQMQNGRNEVLFLTETRRFDPNFLTYDFATWARVPAFHGYDPLVAKINKNDALETVFIGLLWHPLDDATIAYLRKWSVRYYLLDPFVPQPPRLPNTSSWKKIGDYNDVLLYEDPEAAPLAYFQDHPQAALPIRFGDNTATIATENQTGTLIVTIPNLPGFHAQVGENWLWPEAKATQLNFRIDEKGPVILHYAEPHLAGFISLSLGTFLLAFWAITCAPRRFIFSPLEP